MKKLLLTLMGCVAVMAANAWTVSYTNPEDWAEVYAYTYGGDGGEVLGGWPGTLMTQDGDLWTVEGEAVPENIIFNNGGSGDGNQTADLVFEAGATYDDPAKGAPATGEGDDTEWTVYYTNPEGWEVVYAYTYGGAGEVLGTWPGAEMTKDGDVWTISGVGTPTNIIFDNGDGGDGNQTEDLVFEAGVTYDAAAKGGNSGDVEGPGPEESVDAPAVLYLIGTPTGWSETEGLEMELVEAGVFGIEDVEMTDETSYFAFTSTLGSWDVINPNRVAPAEKDAPYQVEDGNPFVWGVDASWSIPAGTYSFYVNFNSMKVGSTLELAPVKTIKVENNGEDVIYNLQGVRVNPANVGTGLYIINGKKVLVK